MQVIDITCNTMNVTKPFFNAIVDGVFLESADLSKMECLITNVYPQSKFNYEFDRKMKWFRVLRETNNLITDLGTIEILDSDYVQQLTSMFACRKKANLIHVFDILGTQVAAMTRADYKAGRFPTI